MVGRRTLSDGPPALISPVGEGGPSDGPWLHTGGQFWKNVLVRCLLLVLASVRVRSVLGVDAPDVGGRWRISVWGDYLLLLIKDILVCQVLIQFWGCLLLSVGFLARDCCRLISWRIGFGSSVALRVICCFESVESALFWNVRLLMIGVVLESWLRCWWVGRLLVGFGVWYNYLGSYCGYII